MADRLANWNDYYHVRFYDDVFTTSNGSQRAPFWTWNFDGISEGGYWWAVASCHLDCNEEKTGPYPGTDFPSPPPVPNLSKTTRWRWSGYSEWVERDIASRWAHLLGEDLSTATKYEVSRNDSNADFENPVNNFVYVQSRRSIAPFVYRYTVNGKWWKSSGRATMVFIPPWWLPR